MNDEPMPPLFTKKGPLPMSAPAMLRPQPRTPPVIVDAEEVKRPRENWWPFLIACGLLMLPPAGLLVWSLFL